MFHRREKKIFPPGTFIPTTTRIVAILQLCFAFSVVMWVLSGPFLGEYFSRRSELLLFQAVVEKPEFNTLDTGQQTEIQRAYLNAQEKAQWPFTERLHASFADLLLYLPPFAQAWLFFSIALACMILLRIEGATTAAWLLPLIALCYAVDNGVSGQRLPLPADQQLIPTERYLVDNYLDSPLSTSILAQREELLLAWQRYLKAEWEGEYLFNVARLEAHLAASPSLPHAQERRSLFTLGAFVLWNLFFALFVNRKGALGL